MDWFDSLLVTGAACAILILIIIELWLWDH